MMKITTPHIHEPDDGSVMICWYKDNARFYISIEPDLKESSWGYVDKSHNMQGDKLPMEMKFWLKKFMEQE